MCTGPHDFIPASNTAKVEMRYTLLGQPAMNVFYFQGSTNWTLVTLEALANAVEAEWLSNIQGLQHAGVTLNSIVCTDVEVEDGLQFENNVGTAGTREGAALPNNVTIAISFRTGFSGRSRRGRLYHMGLVEPDVTDNSVGVLVGAALLSNYGNFFSEIASTTTTQHVIVSYCNNGDWRTDALITPVASYVLTDTTVDTQRKRLPA